MAIHDGVLRMQKLKSPPVKTQSFHRLPLLKLGVAHNTLLRPSPSAMGSIFLFSAFSVHAASFSPRSSHKCYSDYSALIVRYLCVYMPLAVMLSLIERWASDL